MNIEFRRKTTIMPSEYFHVLVDDIVTGWIRQHRKETFE